MLLQQFCVCWAVPLKSSKRQKRRMPRQRQILWARKTRHQRKIDQITSPHVKEVLLRKIDAIERQIRADL